MRLQYFVHENETGKRVEIEIEPALQGDLESTKDGWQSDWTSAFIADPKLLMLADEGAQNIFSTYLF